MVIDRTHDRLHNGKPLDMEVSGPISVVLGYVKGAGRDRVCMRMSREDREQEVRILRWQVATGVQL